MVKHSSIYAAGNISRQLVGFLMLPIYTRYLSPSDYGVIALIIFIITLIELAFGARMAKAVPKFYYEDDDPIRRYTIISTALIITTCASGLATLGLFILSDNVSVLFFNTSDHGLIIAFLSTLLVCTAVENYALVYIRILGKPWLFISISLAKLITQLSLNIYFIVFLKMGILGIAVSTMLSSILFALLLGTYTLKATGLKFSPQLGMKMFIYCWPLWLAGFAGLYIGSVNRYYINVFSSLSDVGLFELATKFSTILVLLIWQPIDQYWQTERFRYYHEGNNRTIYNNVFNIVSTILILATLGISFFSGPVIKIMASSEFHAAIEAVPYLTIGALFSCLVIFMEFSFLVTSKTGWIVRNQYLTAFVVTVLYLLLIPTFGYIGAAIAAMLAQIFQFFLVYARGRKFFDMEISLKPLMLSLAVAIAIYTGTVQITTTSLIGELVLKLFAFILCMVILTALLLRNNEIRVQMVYMTPERLRKWM
ncbi:MAG: oligosaccharide flippase family protein [Gammaproteobacteria bacterium]|nr:oligosaccharide flippase family protein [Gammaproteobacteria bacterium]